MCVCVYKSLRREEDDDGGRNEIDGLTPMSERSVDCQVAVVLDHPAHLSSTSFDSVAYRLQMLSYGLQGALAHRQRLVQPWHLVLVTSVCLQSNIKYK